MTKKNLLIPCILLFIISACNNNTKISIKGTIENGGDNKIYLTESPQLTSNSVDSVKVRKNGSFKFKIKSDKPKFLELIYNRSSILLITRPGENITITTSFDDFASNYQISGSKSSEEIAFLNRKLKAALLSIDSLKNDTTNLFSNNDTIQQQIDQILSNHKKFIISYILNDLTSLSNIVALYQKTDDNMYFLNSYRDIQYFKLVNDSLSKYYPEIPYVKSLTANTNLLLNDYHKNRLLSQVKEIKTTLPDIKLPDVKGDSTCLSFLKGDLVLLFFWTPVLKENMTFTRQLIPLYNKYKNKGFDIYQVAFEQDRKTWEKIIQYEEVPWTNVTDQNGANSIYLQVYNISNFPTTYLIDKTQENILGKNLSLKQLDLKLNYLLNN